MMYSTRTAGAYPTKFVDGETLALCGTVSWVAEARDQDTANTVAQTVICGSFLMTISATHICGI